MYSYIYIYVFTDMHIYANVHKNVYIDMLYTPIYLYVYVYICIYMYMLWPVRGQKEDTEEENVDRTKVLKNRTYIQSKSVSTADRSVRPKTVRFDCWEEVSPRVNRVCIYKEGRVHYRIDGSP